MRRLFLFGIVILLGCQEDSAPQQNIDYLDFPEFTGTVLKNMDNRSADAEKWFILNNKQESKSYTATDSTFWSQELQLLAKIDLNAPKYRDVIEISTENADSTSNLFFDRITSTNPDTDLRKIDIFYLDNINQIRKLHIDYATKNFFTESRHRLTIWLNDYNDQLLIDSLVSSGVDKVRFQKERNYESHVQRVRR